ncbi:MAG: hypothetical protein WC829_04940 [Hyphomicrobium sp.]|jgi:hypothetical protein
MSALSRKVQALPVSGASLGNLDDLILARIACSGGATRAQVVRDMGPIAAANLAGPQWRTIADTALAGLMVSELIKDTRSRLRLTERGEERVARYFGEKQAHSRTWSDQRDLWLIAKALGADASKPALRSALSRLDGLSALVVQHAFGLSMRQALSPSKLRAALALVALERAFGGNVKEGLEKGAALSAKAGRVLAGQLLSKPRELVTDTRLIAALCADQVGLQRCDVDGLQLALLRRLASVATPVSPPIAAKPVLRETGESLSPPPPQLILQAEQTPQPPGLAQFSAGVLTAARTKAEGWPGARKAFISRVWDAIRTSHPEWGLSEIDFKDMLTGAHRAGQLVLTGADLKNKQNIKEFEDSAILYKNTVWHYVRVED